MNRREEYRSIHQNSLRFLKDAKNLPYLTNKKVTPYQIVNPTFIDVNDSYLKKIQTLFEKKFSEFETNVSLIAGLTFSCPSMLFQVNLKNGTKIYESITISVSETEQNGAVSWPLLLVLKQSKKDLLMKIHNFIQRTFKCNLRLIQLTEPHILWLIGITVNETLKRNLNCGMSLTCKLPTKNAAEIDIYFNNDVLSALWDSTHDSLCDIIQFEEIKVLFDQMTSHINNVYGIDVSQLSINSVLLKGVRLQFHDQFQINAVKPEMIYLLLSFVVSDCLVTD